MTRFYGLAWFVSGLGGCFGLDACPYLVLLIRVNLCNLWTFQKTGSRVAARDDTVLWSGVVCFGVGWLFLKDWIPARRRDDTANSLT